MTNIRNSIQVSETLVFRDSLCAKGKSVIVLCLWEICGHRVAVKICTSLRALIWKSHSWLALLSSRRIYSKIQQLEDEVRQILIRDKAHIFINHKNTPEITCHFKPWNHNQTPVSEALLHIKEKLQFVLHRKLHKISMVLFHNLKGCYFACRNRTNFSDVCKHSQNVLSSKLYHLHFLGRKQKRVRRKRRN